MKKFLGFATILLVCILSSSCRTSISSSLPNTTSSVNQNSFNLIDKGIYYEIYDISTSNQIDYKYFIYNQNHEVILEGITEAKEPKISWVTNEILKIYVSGGTNAFSVRYIDVINNRISDWTNNVYAETNQLIAYMDTTSSILVDYMFGEHNIRKFDLQTEIDIANSPNIYFAKFNKEVIVEYTIKNSQEKVIESFELAE